jgi:GDP-4-dehydro-6-deoxy-D-mannose reductase
MPPSPDSRILDLNVFASTILLEVIARQCPEASVLVVGSGAQYGRVAAGGQPVPETAPMRPEGMYGRSKVLQEAVALRYADMAGLRVVCVRPFPVVGPGQSARCTVGRIVQRIVRAEADRRPATIQVSRPHAACDLTDVRDLAQALLQAILEGAPSEVYNVGSGVATSVDQVVGTLASMAATPVTLQFARRAPNAPGTGTVLCDASRLRAATAWAPEIPMERSLADALADARRGVAGGLAANPPEQGAAE